jgi:cell division septal protein FtsQ
MKRSISRDNPSFLRREQSQQLRRSRSKRIVRRRLIILAALFTLGVAGGATYAARYYLTHAPRFRLRRIELAGAQRAPRAEVLAALERYRGKNLFRLNLARLQDELGKFSWVERAFFKRVLPDGLFCAIEERVPRGLALLGGRVQLVDGEGLAIALYGEGTSDFSFPIFTGIQDKDEDRARAQILRGLALLAFLEATYPDLTREISEIDLARDDRVTLQMNEGGPVVRLHPEDFDVNLVRYLAMRDYLATHFGDGAYVDLRFRDRIAFRPLLARGR